MDSSTYKRKKEFAEFMVRAGVLTFGDFTTKSGRKTPYFINTGNVNTGARISRLGSFYAGCISEQVQEKVTVLFGPAYKGIPLVVSTAIALEGEHHQDMKYCFNRKEAKDHGEGGSLIGHQLISGDSVLIIEDVLTAGTAVREVLPLLMSVEQVHISGLVISVDRMERGQTNKTAIQELHEEYGIKTYSIITIREIIDILYNVEIDGVIALNKSNKTKMEAYLDLYCGK